MEFRLGDLFSAALHRRAQKDVSFKIGSVWKFECRDKDGNLKWVEEKHNVVTNEGINKLLNVMFKAATQITAWYIAVIESSTTPVTTMTYASPVYTECTAYSEAARQACNFASASSQSITNSASQATFTFNSSKTIYGAALVGGGTAPNTPGDVSGVGTLFCAAQFSTSKSVVSGDTLTITVTVSGATS